MNKILKFFLVIGIIVSSLNAQDRLSKIINNNELKVCIWPQYYGISYIDPRTQELKGIDSDLAVELASYLNVKLKFVKSSFPTLIDDITKDRCDIAMYAIGKTKQRMQKIRFTTPHLQSDIYAITTKSNKKINSWNDIDKNGVIVAVAKGTFHEPIMKKKLKKATLLVIKGFKQREEEVQSGRADVFMTDYPYSMKMLDKTDWARLIKPTSEYSLTSYAWALAYGDDKFYNKIENFIHDIKTNGKLTSIAKKNGLEAIARIK